MFHECYTPCSLIVHGNLLHSKQNVGSAMRQRFEAGAAWPGSQLSSVPYLDDNQVFNTLMIRCHGPSLRYSSTILLLLFYIYNLNKQRKIFFLFLFHSFYYFNVKLSKIKSLIIHNREFNMI